MTKLPCLWVDKRGKLVLCSAHMDSLKGYRFSDIPEAMIVVVDPRIRFSCCERAESLLAVLINKLVISNFMFSTELWLPQPHMYAYSKPAPYEHFQQIAREAEKLGFEARLNSGLLEPLPAEYKLVLTRVLTPRERELSIIDVVSKSLLSLGYRIKAWVDEQKEKWTGAVP